MALVTMASIMTNGNSAETSRDAGQQPDAGKPAIRRLAPTASADLFAQHSWYVPPPPPPAPKPVAPPLPFQYFGHMATGQETKAFLNYQGRVIAVKTGEVINGTYAVQSVSRNEVIFVYLPLKETQTLATGTGSNGARAEVSPMVNSSPGNGLTLDLPATADMGITFNLSAVLAGQTDATGAKIELTFDPKKISIGRDDGRLTLVLKPGNDGVLKGSQQFSVVAQEVGNTTVTVQSVSVEDESGATRRLPAPPPYSIRINP